MNRDHPMIISDATLHKKVFIYDSSKADERFFKKAIVDYLNNSKGKTFTQTMFEAIWERNDKGRTLKYCFFNEHTQKVRIDNYFFEWMKRTIVKAEVELKTLNSI